MYSNARTSRRYTRRRAGNVSYFLRYRLLQRLLLNTSKVGNMKAFLYRHRFSFLRRFKYTANILSKLYIKERRKYVEDERHKKYFAFKHEIAKRIRRRHF